MCRFIETICVREGKFLHLTDHQERMDRTILHFYSTMVTPDLASSLTIPENARRGWYKCSIIYGQEIEEITWEPYNVRKISSLSLVHSDDIDYSWKQADRSIFKDLIRKAQTDDVIIVKNGYITDSSYANLLFRCGKEWITPSTPLLAGTQRKRLIQSGVIKEEVIREKDLIKFDRIKWINAMLDMENGPEWRIEIIKNKPG